MPAPAPAPAPTSTTRARRPRRLLEEAAGSDEPASWLAGPGANVQSGSPAPPAEPAEVEVEAGVESSSAAIGIVVVAAGGSLWTLCLWYVLHKRRCAHCRSGLDDSEASSLHNIEVYIKVNGDTEKDTNAPDEADNIL